MSRIMVLWGLGVCLAHATYAAPIMDRDLLGWKDLRWGMTPATVRKLHPEAKPGDPGKAGVTELVLPSIKSDDTTLHILLRFRRAGRLDKTDQSDPSKVAPQLYEVAIMTHTASCTPFLDTISATYGQPTSAPETAHPQTEFEFRWDFPSTSLVLHTGPLKADGEICAMAYFATKKSCACSLGYAR